MPNVTTLTKEAPTLQKIGDVFACPQAKSLFRQYCIKERYPTYPLMPSSIENFIFLENVAEFRKITNLKTRKSEATRIFGEFLQRDSLYELNVNHESIKDVETMMGDEYYVSYMFDDLQKQIEYLMKDTLMRFEAERSTKRLLDTTTQPIESTPRTGPRSSIIEFGNFIVSLLPKSKENGSSPKKGNHEPLGRNGTGGKMVHSDPVLPFMSRTRRKSSGSNDELSLSSVEKHQDLQSFSFGIKSQEDDNKKSVEESVVSTTPRSNRTGVMGFIRRLSLGNIIQDDVKTTSNPSNETDSPLNTKKSLQKALQQFKTKFSNKDKKSRGDEMISDPGTESDIVSERSNSIAESECNTSRGPSRSGSLCEEEAMNSERISEKLFRGFTTNRRNAMKDVTPSFEDLQSFKF